MSDLVLETPEGVALRFELAGPGTRILAAALDGLVLTVGVLGALLTFLVTGLEPAAMLLGSGLVLLVVAYWFVTPLFLAGRTPGKVWLGIRVCDAQGFAPSAAQHFLRAVFVPLEASLVVPFPIVWGLIAATPRRQRLGDLVAGTMVLRDRAPAPPPEPVPGRTWSELEQHRFALDPREVRRLGGRDLALLRDLLTRRELDPDGRRRLIVTTARHYAERLAIAVPKQAESLAFLRELFLLLRELRGGGEGFPPGPVSPRPAEASAADPGAPPASAPRPR